MESWQYKHRLNLPLRVKEARSIATIRKFYQETGGNCYISFSGGKDSSLLKHLTDKTGLDMPLVFCNTGLEYPDLVKHVHYFIKPNDKKETFIKYGFKTDYYPKSEVYILYPKKNFREVLKQHGVPVVSKEQAAYIRKVRESDNQDTVDLALSNIQEKYKYLIDAPFKISEYCCSVMKKAPFRRFETETGLRAMIGTLAEESFLRRQQYMKQGSCIYRDKKRIQAHPLIFWKEQEVLRYIMEEKIVIPEVYGKIKNSSGYYYTEGVNRTGCMFCLFGIQHEGTPNRIQLMKESHPKIYNYCLNQLGYKKILKYMNIPYK